MIKLDFGKKDSHFWMALIVGLTYMTMAGAGIVNDLSGGQLGLSWLVNNTFPLKYLEETPLDRLIFLGSFYLVLDAFRVFTNRKDRFIIWLYMMIMQWVICSFAIWTLLFSYPHIVGNTMAYIALTAVYAILFFRGPPLVGKGDVRWEEQNA